MSRRTPAVPPELEGELGSDAFLADPYPIYARLRAMAPVAWSETQYSWMLTRYDDVMAVLKDPRMSNAGRMRPLLEPLRDRAPSSVRLVADHYDLTPPFMTPPRHTGVKSPLQRPFTNSSVS